ncbi:MAG: RlmE family RNA methyltransferase [Nitrososphaera sp.]|jgi:23S rRNA (uridine2552-2'-O)-methyltransferase
MRLADARKDHYRKLAKDQGFRSRSAYKLIQLNNSYHLLRRGNRILDIGCAPGGWIQVAKRELGDSGTVLGIDLKPVDPIPGAVIITGNIEDPQTTEKILAGLGGPADLVLSDLAPNVSGVWDIDHHRQISLTRKAYEISKQVLRIGGNAVFKVFEGESLAELRAEMKGSFDKLILSKPTASRQESSELYLVCLGRK